MKLKEFSYETEDIRKRAILSFFTQTGSFHLNTAAIKMTNASEGYFIKFFQDEEKSNWYFSVAENKSENSIELKNYSGKSLVFCKKELVRDLIKTMNIPDTINKLNITGPTVIEDEEYFKLSL